MSGRNRLATATSPYLLQHADNPVHWWPWCDEAFDEAAARDVPVFLSVGYAACHWCHVMAHESFEDPQTAMLINDHFVAIKVDREERPDVDAVYMQATQAITGHGGWPMTVFLTPDRRPFYAGTYFPPAPRHAMPSFPQVAMAVAEAWHDRRADVVESAAKIVDQLANLATGAGGSAEINIGAVIGNLRRSYDPAHGGFGGAPKFPPSMVLEALLRHGGDEAMIMVNQTCEAMARGGICDQLGGGFARYSVDARWVVPHFEKMLYDNALLLGVYTHWWRRTEDPLAARVVAETVDWLLAEMRTPEGAASTLQLLADPDDPARLAEVRERLRQARAERSRPARDDKVVAAWNGWLVDSLVTAAMVFDRGDWLAAAVEAAEAVWRRHWQDGRLRRASRDGQPGTAPGIAEDYAALAQAATRLAGATGEAVWLDRAQTLVAVLLEQFDDEGAGFFDTAADAETLYTRPQDPTDSATPSGLSAAVHALRLLAELTGEAAYADRADRAAASVGGLAAQAPRFAGWLLADAISTLPAHAPVQVAIVGPDDEARAELVRAAWRRAPAGSVVLAGEPDQPGFALLADRPVRDGRPTAYVCRGFVCRLPVTSVEGLLDQLG